jgi:2-dehydropantoate 2-reductase|tara:strand:+ start:13101 stop:14012 length:912 start_codon:yes stop_codon:yes gene_type:complete
MKIAIMGAGAVGSYYGAILKKYGFDVTLIARGKHYEQIIKNGLEVESFWGNFNLKIPCFNNVENLESFDLIFLTTKLYSNNQSIKDIKKISDSETIIITIQNGVNSHNEISKEIKSKNIIPAATYIEAEIPAPGVVLQKGSSVIIEMGELNGEITKRIKEIKNTFSVEELTINISKNILSTLWKKMIIVGSFGTIMSSFRASFVDLINSNYGEDILMQTMKEILSVGIADGINLSDVDINQNILDLKKEPESMTSSMQNDLNNSKPLEIDSILGYVVNLSKKYNIPTPYSTTLVASLNKFKKG